MMNYLVPKSSPRFKRGQAVIAAHPMGGKARGKVLGNSIDTRRRVWTYWIDFGEGYQADRSEHLIKLAGPRRTERPRKPGRKMCVIDWCERSFKPDGTSFIICGRHWKMADPKLRATERATRAAYRKFSKLFWDNKDPKRWPYPRNARANERACMNLWIEDNAAFLAIVNDVRIKVAMGLDPVITRRRERAARL